MSQSVCESGMIDSIDVLNPLILTNYFVITVALFDLSSQSNSWTFFFFFLSRLTPALTMDHCSHG